MYQKLLKILWIFLLSSSYATFSYNYFNGWWYSSIGTLAILLFGYLLYRRDFLRIMGLKVNWKIIIKSMVLATLIITGAFFIMKYIGNRHEIAIEKGSLFGYYHIMFYTLNEEIILGAIIIYILKERMKVKPFCIAIGLALFFACIHFVFYKWIFVFRCNLSLLTLLTLFFVAILRNILILKNQHIGFSWALHFGWMAIMFNNNHYYISTDTSLTEPERFDTYLGSYEMLIVAILLALASLFLTRKSLVVKSKHEVSEILSQ